MNDYRAPARRKFPPAERAHGEFRAEMKKGNSSVVGAPTCPSRPLSRDFRFAALSEQRAAENAPKTVLGGARMAVWSANAN